MMVTSNGNYGGLRCPASLQINHVDNNTDINGSVQITDCSVSKQDSISYISKGTN